MNLPTATQPPSRSCAQAYVLCAASLLLISVVGLPLQLWSFPLGLAVTELLILLTAVLFVRVKGLGVVEALALHPVTAGLAVRSVVLGVTAWGMAGALYLFVSRPIFGNPPSYDPMEVRSVPQLLLKLLVGAVLPGICEEALFRGAIFGVLQRKGASKAILISAALFAVYHLNPWILAPVFFLGVLLGMLRARTGSLVPGMIAHASVNAATFIIGYAISGTGEEGCAPPLVIGASVLFVLAAIEFLRHAGCLRPACSPLAALSAGLSWRMGLASVGALVVFIGGVRLCVRILPAPQEQPALGIHQGDIVIVAKSSMLPLRIGAGDRVVFPENKKDVIRRVTRVEEKQIWVGHEKTDGTIAEWATPRSTVIGKVIYAVPGGARLRAGPSR